MLFPPTEKFILPEAQADLAGNPARAHSVCEPKTGKELDPYGSEAVPSALEFCAELQTFDTESFGADPVLELETR